MSLRDQMSKTMGEIGRMVRSLTGSLRPVCAFGEVPLVYVEQSLTALAQPAAPLTPAVAKILEAAPFERAMRAIAESSLANPLAYVSADHVGWLAQLASLASEHGKPVELLIALDAAVGGFGAQLNAEGRGNLLAVMAHAHALQLRRER